MFDPCGGHLKGFKTWSSLKWHSVSFESTRLWILFFWDESQADWKSKSPSPWKVPNDVSKSTCTTHCALLYYVIEFCHIHVHTYLARKSGHIFIFMKIVIQSIHFNTLYRYTYMYLVYTLMYVCAFVFVYLRHLVWIHSIHKPFHLSVALPVRISLQPATPCCTPQRGDLVLFTTEFLCRLLAHKAFN